MKNAFEEKKVEMTPGEAAFIARFTADYCRPHKVVEAERLAVFVAERQMAFLVGGLSNFALAAGPSTPAPTEVQSPDEEVTFTFVSEGAPDAPEAWKASLTVPPKARPETMLTLVVEDVSGARCGEGVFTLSGAVLPLVDGRAEIPFGMFLAGIKDTAISFRRTNGEAVRGTLAFFC